MSEAQGWIRLPEHRQPCLSGGLDLLRLTPRAPGTAGANYFNHLRSAGAVTSTCQAACTVTDAGREVRSLVLYYVAKCPYYVVLLEYKASSLFSAFRVQSVCIMLLYMASFLTIDV